MAEVLFYKLSIGTMGNQFRMDQEKRPSKMLAL